MLLALQVFIVDTRASKAQINLAVQRLYDIQTKKINTLIRCATSAATASSVFDEEGHSHSGDAVFDQLTAFLR